MNIFNKMSIRKRLVWTFLITICFFILISIVAISAVAQLKTLTEDMYNHPLVVSNASFEARAGIIKMHRNLKNIILENDVAEVQKNIREIDSLEKDVYNSFDDIRHNILGDDGKKLEKETREILNQWKPVRDRVISYVLKGDKETAIKTTNSEGNILVASLESKTLELNQYARKRAEQFYQNTLSIQKYYNLFLLVGTIGIIIILVLVFSFTTKSLLHSINTLKSVMYDSITGGILIKAPIEGKNEIVEMASSYNVLVEEQNRRLWAKDGINTLSEALSGVNDVPSIAEKTISLLSRQMDAGRGVLYICNTERNTLDLAASYAFTKKDMQAKNLEYGNGAIGQSALERKPILIMNISDEDNIILTGTTSKAPLNTYTFPLIFEDRLYGVIELASFQHFTEDKQSFLSEAAHITAINLYAAIQNERIHNLLFEANMAKKNAEEMSAALRIQSEELREVNARLEEQQQTLHQQSEELQQTNSQLEEQHQMLRQQSEELIQKNDILLQKTDELEQASGYKSQFLTNMSHELRTPLNSIILLSKSMLESKKIILSQKDAEKVKVIYSAGNELLNLINDILDISKIEAGKAEVKPVHFHSGEFADLFKDMFDAFSKDKELEFSISDEIDGMLYADKNKLGQIIRNLLTNAFKFTDKGEVSLKLYFSGDSEFPGAISVKDSGIGISKADLSKIFEAFHQVDGSVSRKYGGTGLGLHICRQISELLGTAIDIKSVPGQGSEFILKLPLDMVNSGKSNHVILEDDRNLISDGEKCILLVEDDYVFSRSVLDLCRDIDVKVLIASDAEEGRSLAESFKPSGIILDIGLPSINGIDFLKGIRSTRGIKSTPISIISSFEDDGSAQALGAKEFIQKPVDYHKLIRIISEMAGIKADEKKKVLIVEDNVQQRKAIIEGINSEELLFGEAESQEEAIEMLELEKYNMVIVDLRLLKGDGQKLSMHIKEKYPDIYVIIYTGMKISDTLEKEINKYADRIILKTAKSHERLKGEVELFLRKHPKNDFNIGKYLRKPNSIINSVSLKGKKILVVDDDTKNIFVMASALEEYGAEIIEAINGPEAIDKLKEGKIDLVLMDIMMPGMSGYECMEKIRKTETLKSVPIIAVTAKALKGDKEKCIRAGANDYISKPINYNTLITLVNAWIYNK